MEGEVEEGNWSCVELLWGGKRVWGERVGGMKRGEQG